MTTVVRRENKHLLFSKKTWKSLRILAQLVPQAGLTSAQTHAVIPSGTPISSRSRSLKAKYPPAHHRPLIDHRPFSSSPIHTSSSSASLSHLLPTRRLPRPALNSELAISAKMPHRSPRCSRPKRWSRCTDPGNRPMAHGNSPSTAVRARLLCGILAGAQKGEFRKKSGTPLCDDVDRP